MSSSSLRIKALALFAAVVLVACGDTSPGDTPPNTISLLPLDEQPRFAVLGALGQSGNIAMLNADFEVIAPRWYNSVTTLPGTVTALSGDFVLPTRQFSEDTFVVIDRYQTDVVTQFMVPGGEFAGQIRVRGDDPNSGFTSNPYDAIYVNHQSAWVTRYGINAVSEGGEVDELNRGTDLMEIDPTTMKATGRYVDLTQFNTTGTARNFAGEETGEVAIYARPTRGLLVDDTLVVVLQRLSERFDAAAEGALVLMDVNDLSVELFPLGSELRNCGSISPLPGDEKSVVVGCQGFARPYGEPAQVRATSGVVVVGDVSGTPSVTTTWRPNTNDSVELSVSGVQMVTASQFIAVRNGQMSDNPDEAGDAYFLTDINTGAQTLVYQASTAYVLGSAAYDPTTSHLFVPDASDEVRGVVELSIDGSNVTEIKTHTNQTFSVWRPTGVRLLN